jgi:hypothetical protein
MDVTISLESLVASSTEITFKFALYNSLLAAGHADDRKGVFDLLRKLYTARCNIVHGSTGASNKVLSEIEARWHEVTKVASAAVSYYALYLSENRSCTWEDHLIRLAPGLDSRLIE